MKSLFCPQKKDSDEVPHAPKAPVSKSVPQPNCPLAQVSFPVIELHVARFDPNRLVELAVVAYELVEVALDVVAFNAVKF